MLKDFLGLLRCLNKHKVKYLIIGGYAVSHYGEPRYTKDLDVFVLASLENARKLIKALNEFGAPCDNLEAKDFAKKGTLYVFGISPSRVDILNRVKGVVFEKAYAKRNTVKISGVRTNYISLDDLLKSKKAAGRPQDLVDIDKLKKFKKSLMS